MIDEQTLIETLQERINDYKKCSLYNNKALKQDILSVQIAISIFELNLYCGRAIEESEKYWFEGGYYLANDLTGEWEDISKMYNSLVEIAKGKNVI